METEVIKIVMVGDSGVGKSSLLLRYVENSFTDFFIGTSGVDYKTKKVVLEGQEFCLELWDTAGQERFRTITTSYYRGAKGVILVYDVSEPLSFNSARQWLSEIARYASKPVAMIVGNKSDLAGQQRVDPTEVQDFAEEYGGLPFMETSAKNGTNVEKAFDILLRKIVSQLDEMKAAEAEDERRNNRQSTVPVTATSNDKNDEKRKRRMCFI
eukprot:TRINITY_DN2092_c1_g1_i1.p1 TRINITY_DN2092_c1_g1~~TRINITY_DN2092_c1_g1_i1.p1  ORF type:complete len:212 (-),score=44.20 TRINITY_DN2092_c1_g1_i1:54-689(-)